ncbi:UbiA-like polyprenyltransferase [Phycisphaerales bacterium AB-hyl4]|uniref:UbiA-like polyprenyltransferase n=1 Tax=Natronomicrosphaera hydrolytica TaxID=3242702 RepID=A0ABV4U3H7_9BACT
MTTATPLPARVAILARDIKLSHSVFALPFALLATFLAAASADRLPRVGEFVLIVVCMVLARTLAMAVNRWADAGFDADNPRTAGRAIPSGSLTRPFVLGMAIAFAVAFVVAAGGFWFFYGNPWPMVLSPAVAAYLAGYSFTKRFTWLCHIVLGVALALSPLAAVIAIEPGYLASPTPWLLALLVTCWVAGFDVIYALQDVGVDREQGLYSMPSRLGIASALWISRMLHFVTAGALVALAMTSSQLGVTFAIAAVLTLGLLVLEHVLIAGSKAHRIPLVFITVNGLISLLLGAAGIVDVLLRVNV